MSSTTSPSERWPKTRGEAWRRLWERVHVAAYASNRETVEKIMTRLHNVSNLTINNLMDLDQLIRWLCPTGRSE